MSAVDVMNAMTVAYNAKDIAGKIELMHYFSIDYKAAGNVF